MNEDQMQSIAQMLESIGLAEVEIADSLDRLRSGQALDSKIMAALANGEGPWPTGLDRIGTPLANMPDALGGDDSGPLRAPVAGPSPLDAAGQLAADAAFLVADEDRLGADALDASDRAFDRHIWRGRYTGDGPGVQQAPYTGPSGGANKDWSAMEITGLASGLGATALGVAAPWMEQDTQYEKTLADRAAGDTIARREGTLAAGQMQRGIMSTSIGRRDISPGLALRNAQMAGGQAASDIMARAAIASAAERQAAENQLAKMRAERIGQSVNAGIAGLSQLGAFASSQAAAQKQDARAQRKLDAYRERTEILGLGRG